MLLEPGDLLIAPPSMLDPRFRKSVLLITENTLAGTQAVCVNRPSPMTVNQLLPDNQHSLTHDCDLFWGGPVHSNNLWLLHDHSWSCDNTVEINAHWSMSSSLNMFSALNQSQPRHLRFCMGFASWAPQQLNKEIQGTDPWDIRSSWLTAHDIRPPQMFSLGWRDLWNWSCELSADQAVKEWL